MNVVGRDGTDHHLVYQHAKGPPVNGLCIALRFKQFGRDVLWRPTEGYTTSVR